MNARERLAAAFHRKNGGDRYCDHDITNGWPIGCVADAIEHAEMPDPQLAQDMEDGRALRLLRAALETHAPYRIGIEAYLRPGFLGSCALLIECECHGFPVVADVTGPTIAEAADAARAELERRA